MQLSKLEQQEINGNLTPSYIILYDYIYVYDKSYTYR